MPLYHYVMAHLSFWLCIIAMSVYIWAIAMGKVSSNKVTWGVWSFVTALAAGSYYATNGATEALLEFLAYFIGTVLTFAVLLLKRRKGEWTWVEVSCLAAVVAVLILWTATKPFTSMMLVLSIDVLGSIPLLVSAYKSPRDEHAPAWCLGFAANSMNLLAIGEWSFETASYPVYLAAMTFAMAVLVLFPRLFRPKA